MSRNKHSANSYSYDGFFEEENKKSGAVKVFGLAYKLIIVIAVLIILVTFAPSRLTGGVETVVSENVLIKSSNDNIVISEDEEEVDDVWRENISPVEIEDRIYLAWDDPPRVLTELPIGVNVLAPCWFKLNFNDNGTIDYNACDVSVEPYSYVDLCHSGGVDVWGTVQCFDSDLSELIVTNAEKRLVLINQILSWVDQYNLDGINIDFEHMNPEHKEYFTNFCKELTDAMPEGKPVSVDVTVKLVPQDPSNWYQSYDRGGLAEVVDYVAVMTYDAHKSSTMEPVASIDWVDKHIQRLLEEVPSEKLLMGVPFHGTDYRAEVVNTQSLSLNPLWNSSGITTTIFQLNKLLTQGSYTDIYSTNSDRVVTLDYWIDKGSWNSTYGISNYSFVDTLGTQHTIWIDDENSIYQKSTLAEDYNLAGIAVWKKTLGTEPMFEAVSRALEE